MSGLATKLNRIANEVMDLGSRRCGYLLTPRAYILTPRAYILTPRAYNRGTEVSMVATLGSTVCRGHELRWGEKTYVMGVLNMTPDSFSGDGLVGDIQAAAARAIAFAGDGADIVDIGGESTRPGSTPVGADDEISRVAGPIRRVARAIELPLSLDTSKAEVADRASEAGASMLNDVWGLKKDRRIAEVAASKGLALVLMHNQEGTEYRALVPQIIESLAWSIEQASKAGVPRENIIIDPGFGFGKTAPQNLEVLRRLEELTVLGRPILIGTSRKSTIGLVLDLPLGERLEGTAATVAIAVAKGADMVRVHDVRAMVRVARMSDAVIRGWPRPT